MEETTYKFDIEIREENYQAWLKVFESSVVKLEEVASELKQRGISFGIKGDVIRKLAVENFPFGQYLVAEGRQPVKGEDGRCECLIELPPKPQYLESDNENNRYFPVYINNVVEGQPLVRYFPATTGLPGITVFGKEILAQAGKPCTNPKGLNTDFAVDNPNLLVAKRSGTFDWDGMKARVEREYNVNGDLSIANGQIIEFLGDLKITGDIKVGITVKVGGDLIVNGSVEDCIIECEGNVIIKGGIFGSGEGKILAKLMVDINHAYNFIIRTPHVINIRKEVMMCQLFAKQIVSPHATILGGTTVVQNILEVRDLGKEQYSRTTVVVGGKNQLGEILQGLESEIVSLEAKIRSYKDVIFKLAKEKLATNSLPEDKEMKLQNLRRENDEFQKLLITIKEKRDKLALEIKQIIPKVIVNGTIYPNVHLTINDTSVLSSTTNSNLTLYEKDNEIVKFKNSGF